MRNVVVAAVLALSGCAEIRAERHARRAQEKAAQRAEIDRRNAFIAAKMDALKGLPLDKVNAELCGRCDVAKSGKTAVCRCHLTEKCDGKYREIRVFFSDSDGRMVSWAPED